MSFPRAYGWVIGVWVVILGGYAAASLTMKPGYALILLGDLTQCVIPLLANTGLLLNAGTPSWRKNFFWMLLAFGCTLWMVGQFQWAYYEIYLRRDLPALNPGDIVFFLRGIPFMAALALQPHWRRTEAKGGYGYLDFALLLMWWTFLYAFAVLPWIYAAPSVAQYNYTYNLLSNIQNLVIVGGFAYLWMRVRGAWRSVYAHLFGSTAMYMLAAVTINSASDEGRYHTGSLYDLLMLASFLWLGTAGYIAFRKGRALDVDGDEQGAASDSEGYPGKSLLPSRLATLAVLSVPLFAIWTVRFSQDTRPVRNFRLQTSLFALLLLAFLVYLRQHLTEADRVRLLAQSEKSIQNLKRVQAQLVQSEKLASVGQLAAGAAHEINNPLTAILGFSDLLAEDKTLPEKARDVAAKIREQARRTKTLVSNLLSFARQVPSERTLLDINTVVNNAVQLRALDLRGTIRMDLRLESVLPGIRGDGNQLMQVFFNILNNAMDAMEDAGNGVLTIKTIRDRGNVVVTFSDTGPGLKDPGRVFDPFYTTKPVGKGTGLGLSICYGIIQDHGGRIDCYNRPEGGAVFRVELPAVLAAFQPREPQPAEAVVQQRRNS